MLGTGAGGLEMSCGTGAGSLFVMDVTSDSVLLKAGKVDPVALRLVSVDRRDLDTNTY